MSDLSGYRKRGENMADIKNIHGVNEQQPAHLKRILRRWDLVLYGMVFMQLVAPVPIFGLIQIRSDGNALACIIVAMVAMIFTALSYGRMIALYPMAGSAYTYVSRSINPHLGFLVGWAMVLDYLIVPLISVIIPALAVQRILPQVPFPVLTLMIVAMMTLLNIGGIKATNRANLVFLLITGTVVMFFFILSIRYLLTRFGINAVFSAKPFYTPSVHGAWAILTGTSLAAVTYIGFDEVTTLAEDTINPKKDIVWATVAICLITGLISAIELYLFQMVWPDWTTFSSPDTAYLDIMQLVGGALLFGLFSVVMSVSQFGAGLSGQVGAARLLYGMGRDNVLPRSIFGFLTKRTGNPVLNILIVGMIAFTGSLLIPLERACDLLNFGAFLGYMGVNLAVIRSYILNPLAGQKKDYFKYLLLPSLGFLFCLVIWLKLPNLSKVAGFTWLFAGVIFSAIKTKGFTKRPVLFNFSDEKREEK